MKEKVQPISFLTLMAELRKRRVFRVAAAYAVFAWLLLQLADVTFDPLRLPPWAMNVLMIAVAVGFPVALIIAWAFQITPEGIRLDKGDTVEGLAAGSKKAELAMIVLLTGVTAIFAYLSYQIVSSPAVVVDTTEREGRPKLLASIDPVSVAVLPFDSFTDDRDAQYFGDGIAEELLNRLAQLDNLRVAARTSSFYFRGKAADITEIANRLAVRHLVEGSIRRDGDRVRITAQLIDAETGYHLWSRNYNRKLTDIFKVQEDIAVSIVKAMKDVLPEQDTNPALTQHGTDSFEAYDLYLQGKHQLQLWTRTSIKRATGLLRQAVAIDDNFTAAHAALAQAYLNSISSEHEIGLPDANPQHETDNVGPLARASLDRALELDEQSVEAAIAEGTYRMRVDDDALAAIQSFHTALEIDPGSVNAYYWLGELHLFKTFNNYESQIAFESAFALDPLNPQLLLRLAGIYHRQGYIRKARDVAQRLVRLHPNYPGAQCYFVRLHYPMPGNYESLWSLATEVVMANPGSGECLANMDKMYSWLGDQELLERWQEKQKRVYGDENLASVWLEFAKLAEAKSYPALVELMEDELTQIDDSPENYGNSLVFNAIKEMTAAANTKSGNYARAAELYRELTSPPHYGPANEVFAYATLAASLWLLGNELDARNVLKDAQSVVAKWQQRGLMESEEFLVSLALLRTVQGRPEEAHYIFQELAERIGFSFIAVYLDPDGLEAIFWQPLFELRSWRSSYAYWQKVDDEAKARLLEDPATVDFIDEYENNYQDYMANPPKDPVVHERVW